MKQQVLFFCYGTPGTQIPDIRHARPTLDHSGRTVGDDDENTLNSCSCLYLTQLPLCIARVLQLG